MRIRITRAPHGLVDGIDLNRFVRGLTYDVGTALGSLLLAEGWAEPVEESETGQPEPSLVLPLSHQRVLVVEDDDDFRKLVSETLEEEGVPVVEARNGRQGLSALARYRPAIIVLDLQMPGMDGREFCEVQHRLADPELSQVPVVIVSGVENANATGRELGAAETFSKPVDFVRLVQTIRRHLKPRTSSR